MLYAAILMVGAFGLSLLVALRVAGSRLPAAATDGAIGDRLSTPVSFWIFGTLFVAAIATGAGRLAYRFFRESSSSEYRTAMAQRAEGLPRRAMRWLGSDRASEHHDATDDLPDLPHLPDIEWLTDSPGEKLRYRLPPRGANRDWLGFATLTLLWNVVWFVMLGIAIIGLYDGSARPVLTFLLIPLGWIGFRSFRRLLELIRQTSGVGPTVVEISDHPLRPGGRYELAVAQWGRMKLRRFTVRLVCEEETYFRQGTDVRVDRHAALDRELWSGKAVQVDPWQAWEQQLSFQLGEDVMHSLEGSHNAIRWRIEVRGEARPWPSFCRSFPVVIHPSRPRTAVPPSI